jgi:hypothetical protein
MGQARQREDVVAAEIADDKNAPMFMISTHTEKQISSGYGLWSWFWLILGLIFVIGGVVVWNILGRFPAPWQPYTAAAGGFLVVCAIGWAWTVYNSLISLHHRVEQAWSQVEVQLKRRNDLIPNLVQTVAGYRTHESEVQQLLAELRGQMIATPPGVAGPDFKGLAPSLQVVIERYPDLKANELFLRLQQALVDTEQRIALARDYYNEVATFHNTRLDIIPDRFVAAMGGLRPQTLMSAADFERAPVRVQLVS